jgi:hypothetical protein
MTVQLNRHAISSAVQYYVRRHRQRNSETIKHTRHATVHVTAHVIDDAVQFGAELINDTRSLA